MQICIECLGKTVRVNMQPLKQSRKLEDTGDYDDHGENQQQDINYIENVSTFYKDILRNIIPRWH